jgi:hypothetical protein
MSWCGISPKATSRRPDARKRRVHLRYFNCGMHVAAPQYSGHDGKLRYCTGEFTQSDNFIFVHHVEWL